MSDERAATIPDLVVLSGERLRALVRAAVVEALEGRAEPRAPQPELVDGRTLMRLLSVSRATLHRMRVAGMPALPVGDTFRYRPAAVLEWLESGRGAEVRETTRDTPSGTKPLGAKRSPATNENSRVAAKRARRPRATAAGSHGEST